MQPICEYTLCKTLQIHHPLFFSEECTALQTTPFGRVCRHGETGKRCEENASVSKV